MREKLRKRTKVRRRRVNSCVEGEDWVEGREGEEEGKKMVRRGLKAE